MAKLSTKAFTKKILEAQNTNYYKQRRNENLQGLNINYDDPKNEFTLKQAYKISRHPERYQEMLLEVDSPEFLLPYTLTVGNICGLSIKQNYSFEIPDEDFYDLMIKTPKVILSRINATNSTYGDDTLVYKLIMLAPEAKTYTSDMGNVLNLPRLYSLTITTDKEDQSKFRILYQAIIGGYEDGLLSLYNIENTHFDAYQSAYLHRDLDIEEGELHDHEIDLESGNYDIQDSELTAAIDLKGGNDFRHALAYVLKKFNCGYNYIPVTAESTIENINDRLLVRNKFFGPSENFIETVTADDIIGEIKKIVTENLDREKTKVRFTYLYNEPEDKDKKDEYEDYDFELDR